ncbi:ZIP family metal transporter [Haloglomus salinum]|uniref:ZIP family metal transporter n=1 Tax=Haloglomus salinum TaxID=2962673 RepID=UPI0020C9FFD5|nr:ZIP family metal transporter [Haloglomus salinum]
MSAETRTDGDESTLSASLDGLSRVGVAAAIGLLAVSALAVSEELWKLLIVGWVAFVAMAGAALLGNRAARTRDAFGLVWGYGLAAGAMVTSAAVFLLPQAFGLGGQIGGFGVAAGLLAGYASHTASHRLSHLDGINSAAVELTAHSLAAGLIIGVIYAALPDPGLLLGLSIVSHKGPAGYAAARRLRHDGQRISLLLLPAAGVALAAIPVAAIQPPLSANVSAAVFGFAAGIFLHLAMDFLPECELGGEVGQVAELDDMDGEAHHFLDRLRVHAVGSTALGALAVFGAWLVIA